MSNTKYTIKVNSPCSQVWASMRPNKDGRFCSSCQKNVKDLSTFTDQELNSFLKKSNEVICGRLKTSQLGREIRYNSKRTGLGRLFSVLAGLLVFTPTNKSVANGKQIVLQAPAQFDRSKIGIEKSQVNSGVVSDTMTNVISGNVFDSELKEPIAGASIVLVGTNYGTSSKVDGSFELSIPKKYLDKNILLQISFIGFYTYEFRTSREMLPFRKDIYIQPDTTVMGEVVIIPKRKWWQRDGKKEE